MPTSCGARGARSRSCLALISRIGDPKAAAPTYDLEAVRPTLSKLTTAAAAWGAVPTSALPASSGTSTSTSTSGSASGSASGSPSLEQAVPPASGSGSLSGAAIDVSEFRFARDVPAGPTGLTVLTLDAAVLAHSALSDLRLVDKDGHQRAYVLE